MVGTPMSWLFVASLSCRCAAFVLSAEQLLFRPRSSRSNDLSAAAGDGHHLSSLGSHASRRLAVPSIIYLDRGHVPTPAHRTGHDQPFLSCSASLRHSSLSVRTWPR